MAVRKERDSFGAVSVPKEAYYGAFTQRAFNNFQISGSTAHPAFISSIGVVKKSCAAANMRVGSLEKRLGNAIIKAADDVIKGKFDHDFILDCFQAGAGTPFNMNANEVIANRANEILGAKKGSYKYIHPNNHVNMSQSTNDVIPTSMRVCCLLMLNDLENEGKKLSSAFRKKIKQFGKVLKIGRTHLQDAVPITFGQVFNSYATAIDKSIKEIQNTKKSLLEVGIGGTAIGTGLNTHPKFKKEACKALKKETGFNFYNAKDSINVTWSMQAFLQLSDALREYAVELNKIANDIRLLNSGPNTGISEVHTANIEPGSSIMPGKVNPSIEECLNMACIQVMGNDHAILQAAEAGQLELNIFTPVICFNLVFDMVLLTNAVRTFREKSISKLMVDKAKSEEDVYKSTILVTALNPYIGYEAGAEIVRRALKTKKAIKEVILDLSIMDKKDLSKILDPRKMTKPCIVDRKILKRVQENKNYIRFRKRIKRG